MITLDFGDRTYRARIYTDTPEEASIFEDRNGVIRRDDERSQLDLVAIADHLIANEGVKHVTAFTRLGYEPVPIV